MRDLVELTVDRMDVYHLAPGLELHGPAGPGNALLRAEVGALFLEFCIVLFCEGRVQVGGAWRQDLCRESDEQASAPPFLLSLFLLSNACAFIYLLLAVWLSMHVRALVSACLL